MLSYDLETLHTFCVLADTLSFSKTARIVHKSQSAVSLKIQRLEKEVGKILFVRQSQHIYLSREGGIFLEYAKKILELAQTCHFDMERVTTEGALELGIPEDLATIYLPAFLSSFAHSYPNVSITVHCGLSAHLLEGYQKGIYDAVVVKEHLLCEGSSSHVLREEPLVWVARHPQDLAHPLPLALAPEPCIYRRKALEALQSQPLPWKICYSSTSLVSNVAAIKAGLGIGVLPLHMQEPPLQQVSWLPSPGSVCFSVLYRQNSPPLVLRIVEEMRASFYILTQKDLSSKIKSPSPLPKNVSKRSLTRKP